MRTTTPTQAADILDPQIEELLADGEWDRKRSTCRAPHEHVVGFDPWRAYVLRCDRELSRACLAAKMNAAHLLRSDFARRITAERVTLWERADELPDVEQLLRLAHALEVPLGAFFDCRSGCLPEWKWIHGRGRARR